MPYEEYLGWQEFYAVEPWGLSVQDAAQAHITSIIANVNRDGKKRPEPYKLADFLLFNGVEPAESAPILLDDPEEQSKLIKQTLFGKRAEAAQQ